MTRNVLGISCTISSQADATSDRTRPWTNTCYFNAFASFGTMSNSLLATGILTHLGLPVDVPMMRPSRAPPLPFDGCDDQRFPGDD